MANCKPGDMAMVVRPCRGIACTQQMLGRTIVKVTVPVFTASGVLWDLAEPVDCPNSKVCQFVNLPDEILQPLPPDGDGTKDARDKLVPEHDELEQKRAAARDRLSAHKAYRQVLP